MSCSPQKKAMSKKKKKGNVKKKKRLRNGSKLKEDKGTRQLHATREPRFDSGLEEY